MNHNLHKLYVLFVFFILMASTGVGMVSPETDTGSPHTPDTRGGTRGDTIYIDADSGDDDTGDGSSGKPYKTIQKGVDESAGGDTIEVRPGIYEEAVNIEKSITVRSSSQDPGDTIIRAPGELKTCVEMRADGIELSGFGLENATTDWYTGVYLTGTSGCTISNNILEDNSIGIYCTDSGDVTITDNAISANAMYGIYLSRSNNCVLKDNVLEDNELGFHVWGDVRSQFVHDIDTSNTINDREMHYLLDQEDQEVPANAGFMGLVNCRRITVNDQDITASGHGLLMVNTTDSTVEDITASGNENGIILWQSSRNEIKKAIASSNAYDGIRLKEGSNDNTVEECVANDNADNGIELLGSTGCTISENGARGNGGCGIYVYSGSTDNSFEENTLEDNDNGIRVRESHRNELDQNQAFGNKDAGLWIDNSENCTVTGSEAARNTNGIYLGWAKKTAVENNIGYNNRKAGAYLYRSSENTLGFNTLQFNRDYGLYLYSYSNDNLVENNTIHSNNRYGIYLGSQSNDNIFRNNTITETTNEAIDITGAHDNLFYNNYLDNEDNCLVIGDNLWNISKTRGTNIIGGPYLGGNFWSDYDGKDADRDGLGDSTYNASATNKDHHPLVRNELPVIHYHYTPAHPEVDEQIDFDASDSTDPDGSIESYHWDFGDGEEDEGESVSHAYSEAGKYQLVLTLTDNEGGKNATSTELEVYSLIPPFITWFSPEARVSDIMNASRSFNISVDQTVDVSWQLDGKEVQRNDSVTEARYTNLSAKGGVWNLSAVVENGNGKDMMIWDWRVADFTIGPSGQLGGWPGGIAVSDDHAYLCQGYGMNVINISEGKPVKEATLLLPDEVRDMALEGNHVYLAAGGSGLQVVDVSKPGEPAMVGDFQPDTGEVNAVELSGDHAFLAMGEDGATILDISDPTDPKELSTIDVSAVGLAVVDDHAYVTGFGSNMLWIYDISDIESR